MLSLILEGSIVKIFVTGATGLVGSRLIPALTARKDRVLALSRQPLDPARFGPDCEGVLGDPATDGDWRERLAECDAIVHLAGENIGGRRWSRDVMKSIRESRVRSTALIAATLAKSPQRADGSPKVWVSGSAMGYYGAHGDERLTESDPPGNDFLAQVCVDWESSTTPARAAGVRVALSRTGHVLDGREGMLPKMARPFRLFAGGPIASGKQWMSWIHIEDMVGSLLFALDTPTLSGPFNAVSPEPVRNREFARILGRVLHRPYWMPVPRLALRIVVGRMAEVITTGQFVQPKCLLDLGYRFRFPQLEPALRDLLEEKDPVSAGIPD